MSNEAAIIVAKDADMFLLLIYVLDQFECFLPYRIWRLILLISSSTLRSFTIIWEVRYLMLFPIYLISPFVTPPHTNYMFKSPRFQEKNLWRSLQPHYDYNIRIEGLLDWKTAQIAKIFVQTIMPDRKFKSGSHLPKKVVFSLLQGKSFKIIKNAFYFRWKALFDFDIITFLSWLFGYVKSRLISKFMTSQTEEQ